MKTYYRIKNLIKFSEEDVFNEGCIPSTGGQFRVDVEFTAETPAKVVKAVADWLDVATSGKDNGVELNACEQPGRVDYAKMETANGDTPRQSQYEAWKNGKCRLWAVIYTGFVEKVTVETVAL